jgi:hypothetical protein
MFPSAFSTKISHLRFTKAKIEVAQSMRVRTKSMLEDVVLRGFEMASGLKVNFYKSSLIGVNVGREYLLTIWDYRWGLIRRVSQLGNLC